MGGLQSGMDTEAMIAMMLEAELQPVKRLEDKVVEHEDDVYAWDMVDKSMAELGGISADLSSYTTWSQKSATTTDEQFMTATAERTAIPTSYTVDVANLAVAHNVSADSIELTGLNVSDADTEIGKEGKFLINGQEISYETDDTLREIAEKINVASASMDNNTTANTFKAKIISKTLVLESGASGTGNNLTLSETSGTLLRDLNILSDTASGVDMGTTPVSQTMALVADANSSLGLSGKLNVNGTSYSVGASDSLTDIRDLINNAGGSASINPDNTLSLTYGAYSDVNGETSILTALGFTAPTTDRDGDGNLDLDIPKTTTSSSYTDLGVSSTSADLNLSGTFQLNGIDVKIEKSHSLTDIKDAMNTAVPGVVKITGDQLEIDLDGVSITGDSKHVFEDLGFQVKGTVAPGDIVNETLALGFSGSFTLGAGNTVDVLATDSLTDIMNNINTVLGTSDASVTAGNTAQLTIAGTYNSVDDPDSILSRLGFSYSSATSGIKTSDPKPTSISVYDFVDEDFPLGVSGSFNIEGYNVSIADTASLAQIAAEINSQTSNVCTAVISNNKIIITDGDLSTITDTDGILSDLGFSEESSGSYDLASGVTSIKAEDLSVDVGFDETSDIGVTGTFKVNGTTLNISATDSLADIATRINALSGVASSVNSDGELRITGNPISVEEGTGNILQMIGLIGSSAPFSKMSNVINQDFELGLTGKFTLDGVTVSVADTSSLEDIRAAIAAIDDDGDGTMDYKAEVIQGKLSIYSATSEAPVVFADTAGPDNVLQQLGLTSKGVNVTKLGLAGKTANMNLSGRINFGGTFIDVDADGDDSTKPSTLKELMDKINSDTSYTAKISSDNRLIIDSGDLSQISDADGILQTLGVLDTTNLSNTTSAEDLKATIDGIEVTASENQGVDSLIDGVNLTFLQEGVSNTVTVNNDTDTIKEKLTEFIGKYNEVMELCEELGKVKLTDEGEVTAAGLLQGDFLISDIRNKARSLITQVNEEFLGTEFNSLDDIGIYTTGMDNRLTMVDEDKLDNALANHFDEMTTMFRGIEYNDDGEVVHKGIMREFDGFIMDMITPLTGRIGLKTETLTTQITAKNTSIAKKRYDLQNYETYLWEHFANMEGAMSSIQAGGQYMMQTLGM